MKDWQLSVQINVKNFDTRRNVLSEQIISELQMILLMDSNASLI